MQELLVCTSSEKPGKDEKVSQIVNWYKLKHCGECDVKRSSPCKDSKCTLPKYIDTVSL